MKKLLLLLIIPFLSFGQLTYIPNDVFEQYLINGGYDDVLDNYVLTSNINTKAVSSISKHPFKHYINEKIRVTLNTDNRLISNTTLSNEYRIAINNFNLDESEIRTIIINGFKSTFQSHNERRKLIRKIVNELEDEFNFYQHLII